MNSFLKTWLLLTLVVWPVFACQAASVGWNDGTHTYLKVEFVLLCCFTALGIFGILVSSGKKNP